eukprot:3731307-Pyramimonas_sp.AAC.2
MTGEPSTAEMRQPRSIKWRGAVVHDTRSRNVCTSKVTQRYPNRVGKHPRDETVIYPRRNPQSHFGPGSRRKAVQHLRVPEDNDPGSLTGNTD